MLFDLCFVVAVAIAAEGLHHAISENHAAQGVLGFALAFFAIWWAWMGFTWFASAFDVDDVPYRLCVLVQIAGVLILASGIPRLTEGDALIGIVGYSVMRLGLVAMWLRAGTARRYAVGIVGVQCLWWLSLLLVGHPGWVAAFVVLAALEISVPIWAERYNPTPWHRHHIAERYGLFTIIVLGESILSTSNAFTPAFEDTERYGGLIGLAAVSLVIVFAMWWLYFEQRSADLLTSTRIAVTWGYGHFLIFGSAAAVGAGLAVAVDYDTDHSEITDMLAAAATAVPVAVYLSCLWLLHTRLHRDQPIMRWGFPAAILSVLAATTTPVPIHLIALVLGALVTASIVSAQRTARVAR